MAARHGPDRLTPMTEGSCQGLALQVRNTSDNWGQGTSLATLGRSGNSPAKASEQPYSRGSCMSVWSGEIMVCISENLQVLQDMHPASGAVVSTLIYKQGLSKGRANDFKPRQD